MVIQVTMEARVVKQSTCLLFFCMKTLSVNDALSDYVSPLCTGNISLTRLALMGHLSCLSLGTCVALSLEEVLRNKFLKGLLIRHFI